MTIPASSLTLIASAMQRELFNRGIGFLTVDECQEMLRASIESALRIGDRAIAAKRETTGADA